MTRKFPANFVKSVIEEDKKGQRGIRAFLLTFAGPLGRSYVNLLRLIREENERQAAEH